MGIGNFLLITFLVFYTIRLYTFSTNKTSIQQVNTKLNALRNIQVKTLEQQKEFLDLKFQKKIKKNKDIKFFTNVFLYVMIAIILFLIYRYFFTLLGINVALGWAILIIIILPIIVSLILNRFNLDDNNLLFDVLRGNKK